MTDPHVFIVCDDFWDQATEYLYEIGRRPDEHGVICLDGLAIQRRAAPPLTAEDITQRDAFAAHPTGREILERFRQVNGWSTNDLIERLSDQRFMEGVHWDDMFSRASSASIGTVLRIRLPSDYTLTDGPPMRVVILPPPTRKQLAWRWLKSWIGR